MERQNINYELANIIVSNFIEAAIEGCSAERCSVKSCSSEGALRWGLSGVVKIVKKDLYFHGWLNKLA